MVKPLLKPLMARLLLPTLAKLVGSTDDDGSGSLLHLVLLLVLGGILIGTCLEVLCHRYRVTWLPGCTLATLSGVVIGVLIRVTNDPEDIPDELLFSGNILFLVCLPIILFDAGFSLRKKEYLGSLFTIIAFSVVGTLLSAFITGGILFGAGAGGMCKALGWNEVMAYSSILSATDALSSAGIYSSLGVSPALMTLVGGEGSLNDAISITMYQTYAGYLEDGPAGENSGSVLVRFLMMLVGSVSVGLFVGVLATFVFRYVHIGPTRDRGLMAFHSWLAARFGCTCRLRHQSGARGGLTTLDDASPLLLQAAASPAAGGYHAAEGGGEEAAGGGGGDPTLMDPRSPKHATGTAATRQPPEPATPAPAAGGGSAQLMRPYSSIHAVREGEGAQPGAGGPAGREGLDGFGAHGGAGVVGGEVKPDSSIFSQVSFVLTLAYVSYMTAEAFHLSGVVSSLFCGIAMNNFVRPLMTAEGKAFSEGTVRTLSATADTSAFFQVGVSIALTLGTSAGINDRESVELLLWTLFAVLVSRAVSVGLLGTVVNYFRRADDALPVSWLLLLWHAGLRGAGTYAFSLVLPTANRSLLVDVTAATVLFTVCVLGPTTLPAVYLLGVEQQQGGHGHGGGAAAAAKHAPIGGASASDKDAVAKMPHAVTVVEGGVAYRVFVQSGTRVMVPVAEPTPAERTASQLARFDARLRLIVSGIVRSD